MCWELDDYASWEAYQKRRKSQEPPQAQAPKTEAPREAETVPTS